MKKVCKFSATFSFVLIAFLSAALLIGNYCRVYSSLIIPKKLTNTEYVFNLKSDYSLLIFGLKVPKSAILPNRVFEVEISGNKSGKKMKNIQFNSKNLSLMRDSELDKDLEFNYYTIENIQLIGLNKNEEYKIKIINNTSEGGMVEGWFFVVNGLFHSKPSDE